MQVAKLTGGAFHLQVTTPTDLVGVMVSGVDEDGQGWIRLVFHPVHGRFVLTQQGTHVEVAMSRQVAMSLIALLHVLVSQVRCLRSNAPAPSPGAREIHVRVGRDEVVASWDDADVIISVDELDGQMDLRVTEGFAGALVSHLSDEIGRFAAAPPVQA